MPKYPFAPDSMGRTNMDCPDPGCRANGTATGWKVPGTTEFVLVECTACNLWDERTSDEPAPVDPDEGEGGEVQGVDPGDVQGVSERCRATTNSGSQCKRSAKDGSEFCGTHSE